MKFAHLADCHIGGWKDPKLRDIGFQSFIKSIDIILSENVDFVVIAGDLFNTSFPSIDSLKVVVKKLNELKKNNIPVYFIAGSHDFSPSGKTMLDVLEDAGLALNVSKGELCGDKLKLNFTIDKKTGAKITGLLGKRGGLDKNYYLDLIKDNLETEEGFKIFLFHCSIQELRPSDLDIDGMSVSMMPKNFNYYAGGHIHIISKNDLDGCSNIVYPGPTFPNNFSELEKLKQGSFCIYDNGFIKHVPIIINPIISFHFDATNKSPAEFEREILNELNEYNVKNSIITLRIEGVLGSGKIDEVDFSKINHLLISKGAFSVLRNTNKFLSKEFADFNITNSNVEDVESSLISEHCKGVEFSKDEEIKLVSYLFKILSAEKDDGEKVFDFENRILKDFEQYQNI